MAVVTLQRVRSVPSAHRQQALEGLKPDYVQAFTSNPWGELPCRRGAAVFCEKKRLGDEVFAAVMSLED